MKTANTETGASFEVAGTNQEQPGASARQQLREVTDQVVDQAKSGLRQAKDRATSSLGESRDQFAQQLSAVADAFRRSAEHLRSENQERVAGLTDTLARQADRVADYVRTFDPRRTRDDLESLARRQPAMVLGGALALGLIGARFFKSSRRKDAGDQGRYGGYTGRERRYDYRTSSSGRTPSTMNAGETDAWS
jgi:hypothetical protein